ncbi:phosphonate ABC transporter substrate-binding protein [Paucibacter sp. B2R-40]|uniref:phosphonate ABC transporter substrate-binding protein n=1 Tax=Paucibacter sp. B2R-40 TaxID=2893554 RepID=UPI0021E4D63C|nr:phosphonate ABC transporter substrate-binding protein [Paucibacter sp. B2R-40]MCV2354618.1 phosphonate ABC transporter substrate-binding protein [Paucibacter sp. B2R-40]
MNRRLALTFSLLAAGLLTQPVLAQSPTKELNFGIISTESSNNLKAAWQPLLDDMQKSTGIKINTFFAPDYAGVIEGMRFNKVQLAWMGNKSAMEAVDRAQGEVFAKVVNLDGTQGYHSLMIVHKDSPLRSLDDVIKARAGLNLGLGDPNSTSGTLVPGFYAFAPSKVDPTRDFKRTVRANHETNILAVAAKQVDVAAVASDGIERMKIKMPEKAAELREVWRSPLIASDPLVWRKDVDADAKKKIADFFASYGRDQREKDILKTLTYSGFVRSDNAQLTPIRQLALAAERGKIEADANLSAEDKSRKLQDVERRLDELGRQTASAK